MSNDVITLDKVLISTDPELLASSRQLFTLLVYLYKTITLTLPSTFNSVELIDWFRLQVSSSNQPLHVNITKALNRDYVDNAVARKIFTKGACAPSCVTLAEIDAYKLFTGDKRRIDPVLFLCELYSSSHTSKDFVQWWSSSQNSANMCSPNCASEYYRLRSAHCDDLNKELMEWFKPTTPRPEYDFALILKSLRFLEEKEKDSVSASIIAIGNMFHNQNNPLNLQHWDQVVLKISCDGLEDIFQNNLKVEIDLYNYVRMHLLDSNHSPCVMRSIGTLTLPPSALMMYSDDKYMSDEMQRKRKQNGWDVLGCSVLITEYVPMHLDEAIRRKYVNASNFQSILFQILYTLTCFARLGIRHNDLHYQNIRILPLVTQNGEEVTTTMLFECEDDQFVELKTQCIVKIFDFDRSATYASDVQRNVYLDNYTCADYGQCNDSDLRSDVFKVIARMLRYEEIKAMSEQAYYLFITKILRPDRQHWFFTHRGVGFNKMPDSLKTDFPTAEQIYNQFVSTFNMKRVPKPLSGLVFTLPRQHLNLKFDVFSPALLTPSSHLKPIPSQQLYWKSDEISTGDDWYQVYRELKNNYDFRDILHVMKIWNKELSKISNNKYDHDEIEQLVSKEYSIATGTRPKCNNFTIAVYLVSNPIFYMLADDTRAHFVDSNYEDVSYEPLLPRDWIQRIFAAANNKLAIEIALLDGVKPVLTRI